MCCLSAPSPQATEKEENLRFKIIVWVPLFLQHTQVFSSMGHVEPSPCSPGGDPGTYWCQGPFGTVALSLLPARVDNSSFTLWVGTGAVCAPQAYPQN